MRVLVVASLDPAVHTGGAETVAASLAEGLGQDHEVTMLSLEEPQTDQASVPWHRLHVPNQAPYAPDEGGQASLLDQARWHTKELYNPASRDAIERALAQAGPFDAASVHNIQGLSFATFDALATQGIPTAYTIHDFKLASPVLNRRPGGPARLFSPLQPAYQAWVRRRIRPVDRFIAPSRYIGRQLVDEGVLDTEDLAIVPNGVPVSLDHAIGDPDPRLTMYGALAPHKGILPFAEAFHASSSDLDLHIAGTGPLRDQIQALADEDARITYHGFLDDETLATTVANSLAVVVPSLWPENCPMVVLESLAAGTPVIHTGKGGLGELAPPGETGLGLPEEPVDWDAFIQTLDTQRLREMRPACRKRAEHRYTLQTMVDAYERALQEIQQGA